MTRRLLLAVSPGEIWAAVADEAALEMLRVFRSVGQPQLGDIYLGRVVALRPELGAALVDIGFDRPAFLSVQDMQPRPRLREGEPIKVEVAKEARADKAVGVTMKLTRSIEAAAGTAEPAMLLDRRETSLQAALRLFTASSPETIVVDDSAALAAARLWLKQHRPEFVNRLNLYRDAAPLFEFYGVAQTVESLMAARVGLPGGGGIAIEATSAAIMIDVDSGNGKPLAANLSAAREIARQIRLRDLSGPIVIDFVGMKRKEEKERVRAALGEELAGDRDMQILGWTRLGHFELVRKRRAASLGEILFEQNAAAVLVKKPLTIALEALRAIQRESRGAPGKRFALHLNPEIAACFDGAARPALRELETRLGYPVRIAAEIRSRESFEIGRT